MIVSGSSMEELSASLSYMDSVINAGESLQIALITSEIPSQIDLNSWYSNIQATGLISSRPRTNIINGQPVTTVVITKSYPDISHTGAFPLALLITTLPTVIILGLVAFGMVKLESLTKAVLPLILTVGGFAIIGLALMRQPAGEALSAYTRSRV
jgi:hypothetical protein